MVSLGSVIFCSPGNRMFMTVVNSLEDSAPGDLLEVVVFICVCKLSAYFSRALDEDVFSSFE